MGKIDSDYLWLHEQPRRSSRMRRTAILLFIPLIAGAAWLTTAPESGRPSADESSVRSGSDDHDDEATNVAAVDARVGPATHRARAAAEDSVADDAALAADQAGAKEIAIAPVDASATAAPTEQDSFELLQKVGELDTMPLDVSSVAGPSAPTASIAAQESEPEDALGNWHDVTIQSGDTLSIAFNRNGLSYADSLKIAHMDDYGDRFTRGLKAGDIMRVRADADGSVLALDYPIDPLQTLEVRPDGNGFSGDVVLADVEHRKAYSTGVINTSFYVDALEAGLSDNQIMQLVKLFGWDIDFALDIRPGDRFVVVRDEIFHEGEKIADGPILAASFVNRDKEVRAVRYTLSDGESAYFSPSGRPMKKAFIRTPVEYTRISSRFSLSRKHPILNRIRRHEGTDYAAPSGTPIKATGNGRIVFRGRRGGYGNMIVIKHDDHLSTRYGHMSKFASGYGVGSKVHQGDIIGYVGMTGLATGPHLHYEFRVDGQPKDPEKVALPQATQLPSSQLAAFKRSTAPLLTQLDTLAHTNVAQAGADGYPTSN